LTLRIAYSGVIQLIAQFSTLITGLVFVTLITRNLSINEFGLWQILGSSVGLLLLPLAPLNYWALRYSARGQDVGKTAVLSAFVTIPFFIILYIFLASTASLESIFVYILIYSIQIPALCIWEAVKPIARSYKPEYLGFATIVLEITKILGAYYTIVILELSLTGAILSLALGQLLQLAFVFYIIRPKLKGKFQFYTLKKWYKAGWIVILGASVGRLSISDSIFVSIILGSTTVVGLFQASRVFTLIIRYSETFVRILYPKLIRDNKNSDITLTIRLQGLVVIPLAVGAFMLSENLLGILGEQYAKTGIILKILTFVAILEGIEFFVWNILMGTEKIDNNINNLNFNKLKNSWWIKLSLIDLGKIIIYFLILVTIMFTYKNINEITLGMYWAITLLLTTIPITLYKIKLTKQAISFEFPKLSILKYIFSGIIMAGFLHYYKILVPFTTTTTIGTITYIIIPGFLSILIYGILILILDRKSIISSM